MISPRRTSWDANASRGLWILSYSARMFPSCRSNTGLMLGVDASRNQSWTRGWREKKICSPIHWWCWGIRCLGVLVLAALKMVPLVNDGRLCE